MRKKAAKIAPANPIQEFLKKRAVQGIAIPAVLLILFVYFGPLFGDKELYMHDIFQYQGMSEEMNDYRKTTGEEALWTNSMFGGMPGFQISTKFHGNFFQPIDVFLNFHLPRPANYIFKLFLGFFFLLLVMRVNPFLAGAGALAFAFSSYFFIALEAGHTSKINAMAYVGPLLAGIFLAYRGKYLLGGAITAFFLALELNANHFQVTYYIFIIIFFLYVGMKIDAIQNKKLPDFLKATAVLIIAGLIGIGPNVSRLWTTYEYSKETMRSKQVLKPENEEKKKNPGLDIGYATQWSYGIAETFTLLIPNWHGGASGSDVGQNSETYDLLKKNFGQGVAKENSKRWPTYFGSQPFTSGPVYVGAIVFFLFILGLIMGDPKHKWWILAVTLFAIMLSWGNNIESVFAFFFNNMPMFNKFRTPSMILLIAQVTMPLLGFIALQKMMEKKVDKDNSEMLKQFKIAVGVVGGLVLALTLIGPEVMGLSSSKDVTKFAQMFGQDPNSPVVNDFVNAIEADRASMLRMDGLRSLAFILLAAGLIYFYFEGKIKNANIVYAGLAVLILVDMYPVVNRYLNADDFVNKSEISKRHQPSAIDQQILQDKDPNYRILNLAANTFNDANTSYFHKSVGGYHAAKLRRYQDLIEHHLSGALSSSVLDMLNTRYIIQNNPQNNKPNVVKNPGALGNAWFIEEVQWEETPRGEINALKNIKPDKTVVIEKNQEQGMPDYMKGFTSRADSTAQIKLTQYKPPHLIYEYNASAEQFVVFSEIYYNDHKGWNAYIDDQPVEHIRVNYLLRGMRVPAGSHKIDFKFEPRSYFLGEKISMAFSILLLLGFIGIIFLEGKKGYENLMGKPEDNQE